MGKDINDLDYNDLDYTMKVFNQEYPNIDEVVDKSTNCKAIKNKGKTKQKPSGVVKLARKTIVIVCIGASLAAGAYMTYDAGKTQFEGWNLKNELGTVVNENVYTSIADIGKIGNNWVYNIKDIANDTLNTHREYDIDTRIYGCYNQLAKYNQTEYMDQVFEEMNNLIHSNPGDYTQDELRACTFKTFDNYLSSKNLTLEEYKDIMNKLIRGYVKQNDAEEKVEGLKNQVNGGSR